MKDLPEIGDLRICVVGLGYVGLPTAIAFHDAGLSVIGVDVSERVITKLKDGIVPLVDSSSDLSVPVGSPDWDVTMDFAYAVNNSDVILITVPTPVNEDKSPDLSYVLAASTGIIENIDRGKKTIVVLESTVFPGVTRDLIGGICKSKGITLGDEVVLAYCPERVNPGSEEGEINSSDQIIGCDDEEAGHYLAELFSKITSGTSTYVGKIEVAEASKLIENVQRDIDLAFTNELAIVLPKLGVDVEEVLAAAETKWNFHRHKPGIGVGGHCIPVDPYYYISIAREAGLENSISSFAREINNNMPSNSARNLVNLIDSKEKKKILILGYSYKAELGDVRETPVYPFIEQLIYLGCEVQIWDPLVESSEIPHSVTVVSDPYDCDGVDAVVIATAHREVLDLDWRRMLKVCNNPLIYDGRRVVESASMKDLGWDYSAVGYPNWKKTD